MLSEGLAAFECRKLLKTYFISFINDLLNNALSDTNVIALNIKLYTCLYMFISWWIVQ
jgi:hypothetical protein